MSQETGVTETSVSKRLWNDSLGWASIRSAQIILVLSLVYVLASALIHVTLVIIPVMLALILAAAITPAVKWMVVRGIPKRLATIISFVVLIVVFGGVITGIILAVKAEWDELVSQANEGFAQLYSYAKNGPLHLDDRMIQKGQEAVTEFLNSSAFGSGALSSIGAVTSFITGFILMAVVLFFFLKDGSQIWHFFLGFMKDQPKRKASLAGLRAMEVFGGYIRGTAIVASVDAVFIGIALVIMQIPLAIPLIILIFIGAFIPIVGATAAGAFAVLVALVSNGPVAALVVLIVVVVVNQLEGNLLQPVLMGNALNVHGLVILLALTVGTILAGIVGAILSVPIVAAGWAVIKVWTGRDTEYSLLGCDEDGIPHSQHVAELQDSEQSQSEPPATE